MAPFDTGFLDHTSDQLQNFITERFSETPPGSDLDSCQYAILDRNSIDANTVVLGHSYSTVEMRDRDAMTEEEREAWEHELDELDDDDDNAWREWRVHFKDAESMSTRLGFEEDFTTKLYNDDFVAVHTDVNGVFNLESAYRAFAGTELPR